jgi:hypothetical protein
MKIIIIHYVWWSNKKKRWRDFFSLVSLDCTCVLYKIINFCCMVYAVTYSFFLFKERCFFMLSVLFSLHPPLCYYIHIYIFLHLSKKKIFFLLLPCAHSLHSSLMQRKHTLWTAWELLWVSFSFFLSLFLPSSTSVYFYFFYFTFFCEKLDYLPFALDRKASTNTSSIKMKTTFSHRSHI